MCRITCALIILYSMVAQAAEDSPMPKMHNAPSYTLARCIALTAAGSVLTAFSLAREDAEMPSGMALTWCCAGVSLYGLRLTVQQLRSIFATYSWDSMRKIYGIAQRYAGQVSIHPVECSSPISPVANPKQRRIVRLGSMASSSEQLIPASNTCDSDDEADERIAHFSDSNYKRRGSLTPLSQLMGQNYGQFPLCEDIGLATYDNTCAHCPANGRVLIFDIRSTMFNRALLKDGLPD